MNTIEVTADYKGKPIQILSKGEVIARQQKALGVQLAIILLLALIGLPLAGFCGWEAHASFAQPKILVPQR